MRVLVTGGSGFLGNACLQVLQQAHPDWHLTNLDLYRLPSQSDISFEEADITCPEQVRSAIRTSNPDAIVHTAGWVPGGRARYSTDPTIRDRVFAVNVSGTENVLAAAGETQCRVFVYTSSCTVISDDMNHDYPLMNEKIPTGNATLSYGASKAVAEKIVLAADSPSLATCALRPATVIGPGDNFGVIAAIHNCIAKWETPFIIGDGDNMYDFVYVSNVADAHLLALENLLLHHREAGNKDSVEDRRVEKESAAGKAFFISNQEPIYFRDFMLAIWAFFGHVPPFQVRVPANAAWLAGVVADVVTWATGTEPSLSRGSVQDALGTRYSDNSRARRILGYVPRVGFVEAVRLACEDYKNQLERRRKKIPRTGK